MKFHTKKDLPSTIMGSMLTFSLVGHIMCCIQLRKKFRLEKLQFILYLGTFTYIFYLTELNYIMSL